MTDLVQPYELTGAELDAVAAGQNNGVAQAAAALIAVGGVVIQDVANNNNIDIDVTALNNVLNGSNVTVGALVNVLGGPAVLRQLASLV